MGADLLELAVPKIADVDSGRKKIKTAAKSVGKQTLIKELDSGSQKKECKQSHSHKFFEENQWLWKRRFYKRFSSIMSSNFWNQTFVLVSGNFAGKVPVVDDVLWSHEQKIFPTTPLDEKRVDFEPKTDRNNYVDLR